MPSFSRMLGKALSGAAEVGVPAAFAAQQSKIQKSRDDRLQGYAKENAATARTFQTEERKAGQDFTAGENLLNREQQTSIQSTDIESREAMFNKGLKLDREKYKTDKEYRERRLTMDQRRLDPTLEQMELAMNSQQLDNDTKELLQYFQTAYFDAQSQDERDELLSKIMPDPSRTNRNIYSFPVIETTAEDGFTKLRQLFRANRETGFLELIDLNDMAGGGMTDMPPAADHKERTLTDNDTGIKYRSDGLKWIEVK